MKKKIFNIIVLLCFMCLIFGSTGVSAKENKNNTLTITSQNQGVILSNMEWKIYRIADVRTRSMFNLSGDFAEYPVTLNNLSTSEMQTAASTLETYAKVDDIIPLESGITDENGIIKFDNLEYGLYLISGKSMVIGDLFYMPVPSLVILDATDDDISWNYDLNTLPKLRVLHESMRIYDFNCSVKKVWTNDNETTRPTSITVSLIRDGEEFTSQVLNKDNNWQYEWTDLSTEFEWNVIEKNVPENYTVTYSQIDTGANTVGVKPDMAFVINNTLQTSTTQTYITQESTATAITQNQSPPLPQTGQLWWPVPLLSAGGMIVFGTGWKINSHKRQKNEK